MFEESSGRKRHKQDESQKEMEPFITEQMVPPEYVESGVQGDEIKEIPKKKCFPVAIGRSAGTQADICIIGTGSHEDPIEPIFAEVGSKVLEQSLLETFEEYELHTIDSEIRALMETRRTRQARNMKLVEQQLYKAEQKEMERIRREKELQQELEATENITATFYSINICTLIMARTLDKMRRHKFLRAEGHGKKLTFLVNHYLFRANISTNVFLLDAELLKEWAHKEMYRRLKIPRMIVDGINWFSSRSDNNNIIKKIINDRAPILRLFTDIIQNAENGRLDAFNLLGGVFDNLSPEDGDFERKISQSEEEGNEESVGPPPNTASSLPYTTSEEEDNNDAFL